MDKPKRLYKYESLNAQTFLNIKGQILYFGSPLGFNDPYDCAIAPNIVPPCDEDVELIRQKYLTERSLTDGQRHEFETLPTEALREIFLRSAHAAVKQATDKFLKTRGVTCFSEKNDDLLMWSHYGGRYKGVCLEFDTDIEPLRKIKKVQYSTTLPQVELAALLLQDNYDHVLELFCTKSKSWCYEQEWRAIHNVVGTNYCYPAEALTGVYFGPDIDLQSLEIVCLILAGQNEQVRFYEGTRSPTEFRVLFREFKYTSYLEAKRRGQR